MNKMKLAIALTIALPTAAFAQPATPDANASTMACCQRDADGNMAGCAHMNGDHAMGEHGADHQGMNHGDMDHGNMNHGAMNQDGDADAHAGHPMGAE